MALCLRTRWFPLSVTTRNPGSHCRGYSYPLVMARRDKQRMHGSEEQNDTMTRSQTLNANHTAVWMAVQHITRALRTDPRPLTHIRRSLRTGFQPLMRTPVGVREMRGALRHPVTKRANAAAALQIREEVCKGPSSLLDWLIPAHWQGKEPGSRRCRSTRAWLRFLTRLERKLGNWRNGAKSV